MSSQAASDRTGRALARQWLKFNAVGAIGVVVQLAALSALIDGLAVDYLIATLLAVEAAILHNFVWHARWTWSERTRGTPEILLRLARFNLANGALSILGNLVCMRVLVGSGHLPYLVANALTIVACSLLNFVVSDRFVFRPSSCERPGGPPRVLRAARVCKRFL